MEGFRGPAIVVLFQAQITQPEPDIFQVRSAPQQLHVNALGVVLGALLVQHRRQIVHDIPQIRGDFESFLVSGARAGQVTRFLMDDAQIHEGLLGVRADANGF